MADDNSASGATAVQSRTVRGGTEDEQEILREIGAALKSVRFGSIVLTIHEGRVVEFTKTVRSRLSSKRSD